MDPLFLAYLAALAILVVFFAWNAWDYLKVNKLWLGFALFLCAAGSAWATGGEGRHDGGTGGTGGADHGSDDVSDPGHVIP